MVSSLNKARLRMEVASFPFGFVYVVALGLCCCTRAFSGSMRASHCGGFPCCGEQTQVRASGAAAGLSCYGLQALEHRSVVVAHGGAAPQHVDSSQTRDRTPVPASAGRFLSFRVAQDLTRQ